MQIIDSILIALVLLVSLYCAKLLRALHQRVSKANQQTQESIKELKEQIWHSYRQSEALQQLLALLKFSAPIPPTRSWAASPDQLLTIADLVRTRKPRLVVELGSGVSTLIVAKAGARKIVVIDDANRMGERQMAEAFAKALPRHSLSILNHEKGTAIIAPR